MTPEEIKRLPASELPKLAQKVRDRILEVVSENGGHLAASLGTVELAIGLLRAFDPPADKVLWDVGHQAYAWKILTDREEAFGSLRRHHGISGFPNPAESPYDAFVAGHAGSALAAAVGLAAARDRLGGGHVVAVVGDASLTNGESLEALNKCLSLTDKMIVVVNDNATATLKNLASLEALGFCSMGPVDGHDLTAVVSALTAAKEEKRSVVVHVVTKKGRGFAPAEANPADWHSVGPFDFEHADGASARPPVTGAMPQTWSDVFGAAMIKAADKDNRVCAVVAAMRRGTGLAEFAKAFPDRFFDVGICEEMAVTFAAGLAKAGLRPVVAIYSTFLQRTIDQIQHDVCLQRLPVVFAVDRAGCVGADGATHHGLYDIPLLRPLTGLRIEAPTCAEELVKMLDEALASDGPTAIRYPKGFAPAGGSGLHSLSLTPPAEKNPQNVTPFAEGELREGASSARGNLQDGIPFAEGELRKGASSARENLQNGTPVAVSDRSRVVLCAVGDQVEKAVKIKEILAEARIVAEVIPVSHVKPAMVECQGERMPVSRIKSAAVCDRAAPEFNFAIACPGGRDGQPDSEAPSAKCLIACPGGRDGQLGSEAPSAKCLAACPGGRDGQPDSEAPSAKCLAACPGGRDGQLDSEAPSAKCLIACPGGRNERQRMESASEQDGTGGRLLVTLENGVVIGGFGESVGADLAFGWPDAVVGHGTVAELEREFGFDAETVAATIIRHIGG